MTPIDCHGRLADRSPIRRLQWPAGHPVAVTIVACAIVVLSDRQGSYRITNQGHLQLPLAIRRAFGLEAGERLLVAACPDTDLLTVYPMSTVDAMVLAYHATITE
ncbi:MAG: hypothetical protein GEV04_24300 [Actinophytocola sp.]|nr:hypothetical protein [Actinophytocola sp.]